MVHTLPKILQRKAMPPRALIFAGKQQQTPECCVTHCSPLRFAAFTESCRNLPATNHLDLAPHQAALSATAPSNAPCASTCNQLSPPLSSQKLLLGLADADASFGSNLKGVSVAEPEVAYSGMASASKPPVVSSSSNIMVE